MIERPTRTQHMRRCLPELLALVLVSVTTACVAQGGSSSQSSTEAPQSSAMSSEIAPQPGLEAGFTHCCGDVDYVMQVECSERLLRCYANEGKGWAQTYGRNCKSALGAGCYERGCISVCD